MEDFKDKPDGEIKCHEVESEPELIIWKNMNTSMSQFIGRRVVSMLILGFIFGFTILWLDWFTNSYLKDKFPGASDSSGETLSCAKEVTMEEAYESALKPAKL